MDAFVVIWEQLREMLRNAAAMLPRLLAGAALFGLVWLGARLLGSVVRRATRRLGDQEAIPIVLGRIARWAAIFVGLLVALTVAFPTFTPANLVQMLGIGSIAIGFAFKDILQNFLAGILILITRPFRIDDQIVFGSFEGTVEDIQTRATLLRTYDGRRVVIPNANLFTAPVTVNTAYPHRRIEYDLGIGVGDDIATARRIILDVLAGSDGVLREPAPDVLVVELADFSVKLRVRWWIQPPRRQDALDARDRVLAALKHALIAAGIDLPFPTQQILFHDQTETTDGDRRRQREGWPAGPGPAPGPRARVPAAGGQQGDP